MIRRRCKTRASSGQKGLSLVELMVALAILGVVMQISASLVVSSNRQLAVTKRMADGHTQVVAAQTHLRMALGSLVWSMESSGDARAFAQADDRVLRWRSSFDGGAVTGIALSLESDADSGPFHLVSSEQVTGRRTVRRTLLTDVSSAEFRYFGSPDGNARPAWQSTWNNAERSPQLVRITLQRSRPDVRPWPPLVVDLKVSTPPHAPHRNAGAGRN